MIYWRSKVQLFSKATLDVFLKNLIPCFRFGRNITYKKPKNINYNALSLYPKKNCVSCWKPIEKQSKLDDSFVELEKIDSDPDYIIDNTDVNSQLENIGISPIRVMQKQRTSIGKRK